MRTNDFIVEALEDSKSSWSLQLGGAHGVPTSQVFFFDLLSGQKVYLLVTEPEVRLEPARDEEPERHDVHDEQRDRDEEQYNEHILDDELPGYASIGLSYVGVMRDVTKTERDMFRNAAGEWFYYSPRDGKYIQTIPHGWTQVRPGEWVRD